VILGQFAGNHFSQPHDIAYFLLLKLQIGVKHGVMGLAFEGLGIPFGFFIIHNIV
jgi:hypothetical protein